MSQNKLQDKLRKMKKEECDDFAVSLVDATSKEEKKTIFQIGAFLIVFGVVTALLLFCYFIPNGVLAVVIGLAIVILGALAGMIIYFRLEDL